MRAEVRLVVAALRFSAAAEGQPMDEVSDEEIARVVFKNYRAHAEYSTGMRLTGTGLDVLSNVLTSYALTLDDDWDTRDLLFMDRRCSYPYHLDTRKIIVFDKVWAARIRLKKTLRSLRLAME